MADQNQQVTLRNNGSRKIEIGGKDFLPKTTVRFPAEQAARLLKLYPNEVADLASVVREFNDLPNSGKLDPNAEVLAAPSGGDNPLPEHGLANANAAAATTEVDNSDLKTMLKADLQAEHDRLTEAGVDVNVDREAKVPDLKDAIADARTREAAAATTETAAVTE